jgi:hypothetical protein
MVFYSEVTYTMGIMQLTRQAILAVCALGLLFSAKAEPRALDNYKSIIDRNPFGLKDPLPVTPPQTNKPPAEVKKEEFYLTGISTIGTPKRPKAYLLAKDTQKKEYDQKYYNLTVGDRQGDVLLKEIDEKGRRVLIVYQGEDRWLSMKDNSVPAPVGPPPGQPPGVPGGPLPGQPMPPGVPTPLPSAHPGMQPQPLSYPNASNRRTPRTASYGNVGMNYGAGAPGAALSSSILPPSPSAVNNPAATVAANPGPQTDADVLKQIATMQNPHATGLPPNIPAPPVPHF